MARGGTATSIHRVMITMKKQTPIAATILLLAAASFAGAQNTSNDPGLQSGQGDNYRAEEFSLDVFGSLSLGKEEIRNISGNVVEDDSELGIGVGLNYFFTRNLGLGADVYSENSSGSFIDSASANLILRLPLGEGGFAPFAYIGGGRQFDMAEEWFAQVGVGIEYRFTPQIGAFLDARAVFPEEVDYYGVARLGMRFGF
jgi:hypothetical protein